MEDIYVNALQRQMLGGLYAQGINLGNQMIAEDAISINEQKKENYPDFIIVINCLLTLLKANAAYYGKHEAEYKPRVQAIYRIARQHIFRLSHMERCDGINLMMCELWDYVEQMLEQPAGEFEADLSAGQASAAEGNGQMVYNRDYVPSGAAQAVRTLGEIISDIADERAVSLITRRSVPLCKGIFPISIGARSIRV